MVLCQIEFPLCTTMVITNNNVHCTKINWIPGNTARQTSESAMFWATRRCLFAVYSMYESFGQISNRTGYFCYSSHSSGCSFFSTKNIAQYVYHIRTIQLSLRIYIVSKKKTTPHRCGPCNLSF